MLDLFPCRIGAIKTGLRPNNSPNGIVMAAAKADQDTTAQFLGHWNLARGET
jgi:hypothetical protein